MAGTKATQSHSNEDTKKKQQKRPLPYILVPPLLSDGPTPRNIHSPPQVQGSEELCLHLKAESENTYRRALLEAEGEKEALQLRVSQLETRLEAEKELRKYFEQKYGELRGAVTLKPLSQGDEATHCTNSDSSSTLRPPQVQNESEDQMDVDSDTDSNYSLYMPVDEHFSQRTASVKPLPTMPSPEALRAKLPTSVGFYQALFYNREQESEQREALSERPIVIFTIYADTKEALVMQEYDLSDINGFARFAKEQLNLLISDNEVERMNWSDGDIFRVYCVDLTSCPIDISAFLDILEPITSESRGIRLGPTCGMEITVPSSKVPCGIPLLIDFVPESTAAEEVKHSISSSIVGCHNVEIQSYIGDSHRLRVFAEADVWTNDDASSLLWDLATDAGRAGKTKREVHLGGRTRKVSRMEFCCYCGYDCMVLAWPHTPDHCGLLQSLGESDTKPFALRQTKAETCGPSPKKTRHIRSDSNQHGTTTVPVEDTGRPRRKCRT
uniref:Uncharacterized protein n=1 Tax=Moniliophthora roreri TaxID=221103 RepID=A0A0W0FL22_MONRR